MNETANQQIGRIGEALRRHDEYLKESEEANEIAHGFVESVRAVLCPTTAPQPRPSSPSDLAHRREAAAWRTELVAAQEHAANMERVASEQRAQQVAGRERARSEVEHVSYGEITKEYGVGPFSLPLARRIADRVAEQLAAPAALTLDRGDGPEPVERAFVSQEYAARLGAPLVLSKEERLDLSSSDRVRLQSIRRLLRSQSVCWDMEIALLDRLLGAKP